MIERGTSKDRVDAAVADFHEGVTACDRVHLHMAVGRQDVAIVGTGPSMLLLTAGDMNPYGCVILMNRAMIPPGYVGTLVASKLDSDRLPGDSSPHPGANLILVGSKNADYDSGLHPPVVRFPPPPLRPMGSQGFLTLMCRAFGAKSVTVWCCDSVIGCVDNVFGASMPNYARHPPIARAMAGDMPISWRLPEPECDVEEWDFGCPADDPATQQRDYVQRMRRRRR